MKEKGFIFLDSEYEILLYNAFVLSFKNNGFGADIDYLILKDYAKKYKFDSIELLGILKNALDVYLK